MAKFKKCSPAILACIISVLVLMITLFIKPYIGMADNGDYYRIISGNGLYSLVTDYKEKYFGYFNKDYGVYQYFNENKEIIVTSQSLFIRLARGIDYLFTHDNVFDIRFLGAIQAIYCVVMIYFLTEYITYGMETKKAYIVSLVIPFIFVDTAYIAYFNSFYSEGLAYISCILCLTSVLLMGQDRYNDYFLLCMFLINGVILTTSKQQNAPNGIILGILALLIIFIRREVIFRTVVVSMSITLVLVGVITYMVIPKEFVNINEYHAMTRGVLLTAENPEEVLKRFNIDPQYSVLTATLYYDRYNVIDVNNTLVQRQFFDQYGFVSILGYYVTHPAQLIRMLDFASQNAFTIRPSAMGNFEKSEGKGYVEKTNFFSTYSILKQRVVPKTTGFIVIWIITVVVFYIRSFIVCLKNKDSRGILKFPTILIGITIGLSQIVVSIIGAGDADLQKHVFLFNVIFDLVNIVLIIDVIRDIVGKQIDVR